MCAVKSGPHNVKNKTLPKVKNRILKIKKTKTKKYEIKYHKNNNGEEYKLSGSFLGKVSTDRNRYLCHQYIT